MRLSEWIVRAIDRFYLPPFARLLSRQTFRYAACGVVTYLVLDPLLYSFLYNFVVGRRYIDLGRVVLSPHVAALILVFPIVFFIGFWLNRNVAFRRSPIRTRTQLVRYALSIAGSILLTYAGLKFLVEVCGLWPTPSKVVTTAFTTVYSYLAAKYFTFRHAARE